MAEILGMADAAFLAHARPEDQSDRLYDPSGTLLFDHDGDGFERPEIDRTALRAILLDSLNEGTVRWGRQGDRNSTPTRRWLGGGHSGRRRSIRHRGWRRRRLVAGKAAAVGGRAGL